MTNPFEYIKGAKLYTAVLGNGDPAEQASVFMASDRTKAYITQNNGFDSVELDKETCFLMAKILLNLYKDMI